MCGNGIRCVAKYAYDHGLSQANPMRVETAAGVKTIAAAARRRRQGRAGHRGHGRADPRPEGRSRCSCGRPASWTCPSRTGKNAYQMTCVSMGNPHAVIYVDDVAAVPLETVGPEIETQPASSPQRINVHFVQVHLAARGDDADLGARQRHHAGLRHGGLGRLRGRRADRPHRAARSSPTCPAAIWSCEWPQGEQPRLHDRPRRRRSSRATGPSRRHFRFLISDSRLDTKQRSA